MAGTQGTVSINFQANTAQAQSQIQALANSLNKLMSTKVDRLSGMESFDKNLQNAIKDAALLESQLLKATNVKTGNLDITKFSESLKASGMTLTKYQESLSQLGAAGDQAFLQLSRSIATAEQPLIRTSKLLDNFAVSLKNTIKWQLSSSLMHGFISSISGAINYAKTLDTNLNNIRIVTGQSADQMARFAEQANRSAQQLSTTTNAYTKAALIFYQQGLGDKEVKERTEAVIKMANVTKDSAEDVSSYMTSIWNNFDDGTKSLEHFADVIVNLGAKTASSSSEIANGLQQFAAVGDMIGLSYEYAASALATIVAQTRQSEQTVGNSLKTIFSRLQGLQLGETLEDGTDLNKYSAALAKVGVSIKDASGELRDMDDILDDLGSKWQTFSKDTQMALAQTVAGVRQYNNLVALMDNYDFFKKNVNIAQNSDGALNKQADIYAQSWEAASNRVRAAWEGIYQSLLSDKFFISMNNGFRELLRGVQDFIDGMGGVKGILLALSSLITNVFSKQIVQGINSSISSIKNLIGVGIKDAQKLRAENEKILIEKVGSNGMYGGHAATALKSELQVQKMLISGSKELSQEEMNVLNVIAQRHHERVEEQLELSESASKIQDQLDNEYASFTRLLSTPPQGVNLPNTLKTVGVELKNLIDTQSAFGSGQAFFDHFLSGLGTGESLANLDLTGDKLRDLQNAAASTAAEIGTDAGGIKAALNDIATADGPDAAKQKLLDFAQRFNSLPEEMENAENAIRGRIQSAIEGAKNDNYKSYLNNLLTDFNKCVASSKNLGEAFSKLEQNGYSLQAIAKILGGTFNEMATRQVSFSDSLITTTRLISSFAMLGTQVKGMMDTWNDDTKTLGEKLLSLGTTLGFIVPMLVSSISGVKKLGIEAIAAASGLSVAQVGAVGFGTALKAAFPHILAVTAAIAAVVGVIYLLYKAFTFKSAIERYREELENTKKKIDELSSAAADVKQKITDTYDAVSDYDAALTALQELTAGTEAWSEQMGNVQNAASTLMETMPILQEIMNNPGKFGMVGRTTDKYGNPTKAAVDLAKELTGRELIGNGLSIGSSQAREFNNAYSQEDAINSFELTSTKHNGAEYTISDAQQRLIGTLGASGLLGQFIESYNAGSITSADDLMAFYDTLESPELQESFLTAMANAAYESYTTSDYDFIPEHPNSLYQNELNRSRLFNLAYTDAFAPKIDENTQQDINGNFGSFIDYYGTNVPTNSYDYAVHNVAGNVTWDSLAQGLLYSSGLSGDNGLVRMLSDVMGAYDVDGLSGVIPDNSTGFIINTEAAMKGQTAQEYLDELTGSEGEYTLNEQGKVIRTYVPEGSDKSVTEDVTDGVIRAIYGKELIQGISEENVKDYIPELFARELGYYDASALNASQRKAAYDIYENPQYENLSQGTFNVLSSEQARNSQIAQDILSQVQLTDANGNSVWRNANKFLSEEDQQNVTYAQAQKFLEVNKDNPIYDILSSQVLGLDDALELTNLSTTTDDIWALSDAVHQLGEEGKLSTEQVEAFDEKAKKGRFTSDPAAALLGNTGQVSQGYSKYLSSGEMDASTFELISRASQATGNTDLMNGMYRNATTYDSKGNPVTTYSGILDNNAVRDTILESNQLVKDNIELANAIINPDTGLIDSRYSAKPTVAYDASEARRTWAENNGKNIESQEEYELRKAMGYGEDFSGWQTFKGSDEFYARIAELQDQVISSEEAVDLIPMLGLEAASLIGETADQYATAMLDAEATIAGIEFSEMEKAKFAAETAGMSEEDIKATGQRYLREKEFQTGISGLQSSISSKDDIKNIEKSLAAYKSGQYTSSQQSTAESMLQNLQFITGNKDLKIEDLYDENGNLLEQYTRLFTGIATNDAELLQEGLAQALYGTSYKLLGVENQQVINNWANNIISEAETQISQAITDSLTNATQKDSYDDLSIKQLNEESANLRKARTSSEDEQMAYLEAMGYFSNGEITEAGEKIRDEMALGVDATASQIYNAIIDGGEEGIAEARQALSLDKDGLLAKSVSEDVRDSYLTTMGRYGKDRDMPRASNIRDVYQNARQYGQDAIKAIDEAFAQAKTPEQLDAITSVLSNLDADATADEISQAFASVGIDAEALGIDCEDLASAMQSAAEATNILTDAVNQYSGLTSAADKLRNEENLTQDEFNTAALAMGNGDMAKGQIMMASYTTLNPDGTYSANEGMGGAIADQLDSYAVNSMVDAANKMADVSQAFYDQQINAEAINNGNGASLDPNVVAATEQTILDYIATNGDRLGLTAEQQSEIQGYRDAGNYEGFRNMEDYDAIYGKANVLAISDTNELQSTGQATEDKIAEDNFDEKVKSFDLDPDEIDDISEAIQGMAESSDELANSLQDDEKEAKEIAKDLGRYDKAIESVTKNYDDWNDALESGNIVDVTKATKEMDEAYSDMLDLDYGVLSDQFLQNKDNLDLMKEAANGSEEAYNQLQQAAQADILMQCEATMDKSAFDAAAAEVQSQMDAMNFQELEIGASLDDAGFLSALTDMVNAAGMTADQATSYLSSMGIDAEVIENPVTTDEVVATSLTATTGVKTQSYTVPAAEPGGSPQTETASFPTVTYSTEPVTAQKETGAVSLQVTSANKSSGGGFKHSQAGGGGGRRGGGGGRRGGGGGGSRTPRGEKKKEVDKERYRPVKNQLEDLTDIYDKVDKAATRAFGKDKVKLLKEQANATKDLIDKQKEYIKEIEEYYQKDKDALKQVQSFSGITFEFDENGTIKNFDEFQDKMFAMYNSHINDKGEVTDMDEETWSNYEKEWEEMMALVDQYDETQDLLKEQKQQLVDYQNDLYDLILETVTYQVEIRLEVDQDSLDTIDFMLKRIGDDAWDAAESIETLGSKMTDLLDENDMYKNGLRDILGNHINQNQYDHEGNLITDANGNALTLSKEDVLAAMNNDPAALAKIDELGRKGAFTEDEVQAMRDYSAGLLDVGNQLMDLREEMYDKILSAFQDMNAEMEESIDRMGNLIDISKKYKDIVGLVGQTALNISDQFMEAIDQRIGDSMISQLQSSTRQVQMLQNQLMEAQVAQQHAMDEGQEYEVERWGEIIKEIQSELDDAQLENLEHLEETLQHFLDAYQESVEKAVARASDVMAGPFAKSLDELREQMDRADQVAERYLPDYEKIYELSKLNRDIQNSIDDTQNVKAKQELAKLQEHINELQESGKEVSEYEVEALRKQYELKLAGLALDEAQDAKSEVRMSRNADGDWSYVYTADEEDVAEAEQTYEDKLFEYQQLNAEYMNNLKDMLIEMEQEYLDAYQELMTRQDLSDEERAQRLEALNAHYQEQFAYYNSELELVFDNNQELYNNDWQTYSDRTGYKISAEEDYVDNFLELSEQTGMGFKTQEEFQQAFNDAIGAPGEGGMLGDVDAAYTAYEENLENTMQAAGMDVDSFKETMASEVADIENEIDNLEASNNDLADNAEENFSRMTDAVQNWSDMYSSVIASILEQNTALKQSFDALMKSWTEYEDGVVGENEQLPGDEPEDPIVDEAKIPSPKPQISKKAVHAAVAIQFWEGGRGNWGTGGTRRGHCADKGVDYNLAQSYCNSMSAVKSPKHVRDLKSYATRKWGIDWTGINLNDFRYDKIDLSKYQLFDTGGYTGVWGDNSGKLAVLHQKEIVLNADDTKNFLSAIDLLRSVSNTIDLNAYASAGYGSNAGAPGVGGASQMLEQNVHIEANFPNVTDRNEIEAAFGDIINLASQYANRG